MFGGWPGPTASVSPEASDGVVVIVRMQQFLREAAAPGRTVIPLPGFVAYLDPSEPLRYYNYAVPTGDVAPSADDVAALRRAFLDRDRLPRLEWLEEAAPRVASALAACGMAEELRAPLMACTADTLVDVRIPEVEIRCAETAADLRDLAAVQRSAFGEPPLRADEAPRDPRTSGGGAVIARIGGEPVAVAGWSSTALGWAEIGGVATAGPWRGRGLAGAVTAAAARQVFAGGAEGCVLSPGSAVAERVYARAGFRSVATMLHWSDAPG